MKPNHRYTMKDASGNYHDVFKYTEGKYTNKDGSPKMQLEVNLKALRGLLASDKDRVWLSEYEAKPYTEKTTQAKSEPLDDDISF